MPNYELAIECEARTDCIPFHPAAKLKIMVNTDYKAAEISGYWVDSGTVMQQAIAIKHARAIARDFCREMGFPLDEMFLNGRIELQEKDWIDAWAEAVEIV